MTLRRKLCFTIGVSLFAWAVVVLLVSWFFVVGIDWLY